MKKSTAILIVIFATMFFYYVLDFNVIDKIIYKLTTPIFVVGYFIVKHLEEINPKP